MCVCVCVRACVRACMPCIEFSLKYICLIALSKITCLPLEFSSCLNNAYNNRICDLYSANIDQNISISYQLAGCKFHNQCKTQC